MSSAKKDPASSFVIPAYAFDRGNAKTFTDQYADAGPMVAFGGRSPVIIEYDFDLPVDVKATLCIQYAAADARPVEFFVDGVLKGLCCRFTSGSWNTSGAQWEEICSLELKRGKHTIKLLRNGAFPHVTALSIDSPTPFPKGCTLARPNARKIDDPAPVPEDTIWQVPEVNIAALRLAIQDLITSFDSRYLHGSAYLKRLQDLEKQWIEVANVSNSTELMDKKAAIQTALRELQQEALTANPLLDFSEILVVKRSNRTSNLGLPYNWQSNSSLSKNGYDDSLCRMSLKSPRGLKAVFKPSEGRFIGDVDLHFDGDRMLFSMPGSHNRWQVFEMRIDGSGLRQLTGEQPDVDSYDACYLPDGRIIITSTAYFVGVPCVYGSSHVSNLYIMDSDGTHIRQLCFDQEHDWCPVVLNNGRILYTRWEYTDTPHSNTRLLFHMNPDGTEQMEFLGSNSYWPNSFFYARPIPGHPSMVVSVIGGHHDNPRMGELVLFDPARGRHEAAPAIQRIPGWGKKVESIISDGLTLNSWPKFLHPYPLSEKYFLVSAKPTSESPFGIYLVDIFDNMVPLLQLPDYALMEPIPLRKSARPPVVPDKVDLSKQDSLVYIQDIYAGDGLKNVPRGAVKQLRLFTYHFAYQNMGGLLGVVGMDGPWDIKRVLGTVPVNPDGSAKFKIPANTPISIQPLDAEGKAVQLMRSWMTAMPGEVVQCTGCHEKQNTAPMQKPTLALSLPPNEIQPWHGPTRGFSFAREVQPVLDRYCVSCHDGKSEEGKPQLSDLRDVNKLKDYKSVTPGNGGAHAGRFSVSYAELHRFVRRPGIESDYHVLEPMEFHADTTQLVQMLKKGHYGVKLDSESWDRLVVWIDLNCPYHGTWGEEIDRPGNQAVRRRELLKRYANLDDDPEKVPVYRVVLPGTAPEASPSNKKPEERESSTHALLAGWPWDDTKARSVQKLAGASSIRKVNLGNGIQFDMTLIPAGDFLMGSPNGFPDERPVRPMKIQKSFWMASREIDNRLYALFNPNHDSRVEDKNTYQFGIHGYPSNSPEQPVVRVSWEEAAAFCRWLSEKTGERFSLPDEVQWEFACRAGSEQTFHFGAADADFSRYANLADITLREFASDPYTVNVPLKQATKYDDWIPRDSRFNDRALLAVAPGRYQPNIWGLFDMHGNVAEWTSSDYVPAIATPGQPSPKLKVVRGGSWRDEPRRSTASFRWGYQPWQRVHNVGFRVVCETGSPLASNKGW